MALSLSGDGTLSGVDIAASGLGKVLQVVRATDGTSRTTTSTSPVDANLSVTITPQKSDSTILLICTAVANTGGSNAYIRFRLTDSSNNAISGGEQPTIGDGSSSILQIPIVLIGYSTPATTSATTYKLRFWTATPGVAANLENVNTTAQLFAIEVSA